MTIRLPHWLARLFGRFQAVHPHPLQVEPTAQESELRHLRRRVKDLMRENEDLRQGAPQQAAKRADIAFIKQADNAQAQANKFRVLKEQVTRMKVLYGQIPAYISSLPLARLTPRQKAALEDIRYAAETIGAVDPDLWGLSPAEIRRVIEDKQVARAVLGGVDIAKALSADHNPQTSNNGALTHDDTSKAQAQTQDQGASAGSGPESLEQLG